MNEEQEARIRAIVESLGGEMKEREGANVIVAIPCRQLEAMICMLASGGFQAFFTGHQELREGSGTPTTATYKPSEAWYRYEVFERMSGPALRAADLAGILRGR